MIHFFLYTNPPTPIGASSFCQNKLYCTKKKKKLHLCTVRYKDISLTPVHIFPQLKIRALSQASMPDMFCPWQGQGEDCHLKVGTLKWMTDNTGPTDQGHSSKPCTTSSGNGRGKLEAGSLSESPCKKTQPSGIQHKLLFPRPPSCPVCFLLSQVGHSPLCTPPFPTSPGKSHDPQGRGLHSSWQSRYKLSFPLYVARY